MHKLPHWAIKAARLWERQGFSDPDYKFLSGKMGNLRILVVPNPDRVDANDAQWILCFGEHVNKAPVKLDTDAANTSFLKAVA